jgi:hypothetical protein
MPIFRGLILLLAIWVAVVLARQLYRTSRLNRTTARNPARGQGTKLPYTNMVACDTCRTHIPKTEAICLNGRYFCSDACRQQGNPTP